MLWTPNACDGPSDNEDQPFDVSDVASIGHARQSYLKRLGLGMRRSQGTAGWGSFATDVSGPELKGPDVFRGKFLQKLAYNNVWVPEAHRPPMHQSVIVFDWDDTLLCTSFLNRQQQPPAETYEHLRSIAHHARSMLEIALKSGHTYIITNATADWVEISAARWAPELLPVLQQVCIISARDRFQAAFPNDVTQWKVQAFLEVQRDLERTPITNLIVLGDADFEMEAARIMGGMFDEALVKTVKFRPHPTSLEHVKQVELVAQKFQQIVFSGRSLKIFLERRTNAKQPPSN